MIFETNISDYYKVVQSSDECCYKYILGKLQEAKEIYIMAFGNSQRNIQLMDSLKSLKGKITVISDIDTIKGENIKRINKINSSFNLDKNSKISDTNITWSFWSMLFIIILATNIPNTPPSNANPPIAERPDFVPYLSSFIFR